MFLLVTGRAQSRGRSDEPIRTQRDRSRSRDRPIANRRSKRRSERESDSSNSYPPIIVGPLTTNQDLSDARGEKVYNLPLMIQQPFLREKKEPIKVDISVKLIPKPKKKDKKKRGSQVEEIIIQADENKGVRNSISMEVNDGSVNVLKETVEILEDESNPSNAEPENEETIVQEKLEYREMADKTMLSQPEKKDDELEVPISDKIEDEHVVDEAEINKEELTPTESNVMEACEVHTNEKQEDINNEDAQIKQMSIQQEEIVTTDENEKTEQQKEHNDEVETS